MTLSLISDRQVLVRHGYSDFDTYGNGNYACAATGSLDAPSAMPQGSVRLHDTGRPVPALSVGQREMYPGAQHDGPETAATVSHWGECLTPEQQQVKELTGFTMGHIQAVRHLQQRAELCRK